MDPKLFVVCFLILGISGARIESTNENVDSKSTWSNFQQRHILDPNIPEEMNYQIWDRQDWNKFLEGRIGQQFGSKAVNSFIIGKNITILDDLQDGYYQSTKHTGIPNNLHWGSSKFHIYVMKLTSSDYDTYNCSQQYILAGFGVSGVEKSKPVHFEAQSKSRKTSGSLELNVADCEIVKQREGNSASKIDVSVTMIMVLYSGAQGLWL